MNALRVTTESHPAWRQPEFIAQEIARANERLAAKAFRGRVHPHPRMRFIARPKFKNPRAKYNFQGRTCSITRVGSYVPAKVADQRRPGKIGGHHGRVDTTRTGIQGAADRRQGRNSPLLAARAASAPAQRRHHGRTD